jgi:hypothetical protein
MALHRLFENLIPLCCVSEIDNASTGCGDAVGLLMAFISQSNLLYSVHTKPNSTSYCQHTLTLNMSDHSGSSDARDTPSSDAISATDDGLNPDNDLLARIEATFDIKTSLREKRKLVDITERMNQLTPDVIREGEAEWIRYYWTMVSLIVPGEKTLNDPRGTVNPAGMFDGMTQEWMVAGFNAVVFLDYFLDPRAAMPAYDINNDIFQHWLFQWRYAAMLPTHAPGEVARHSIPSREEIAAYRNWQERHNINFDTRYFAKTSITFEILVMWDFNATAPEGDFTLPRISAHNIRSLLDVHDAIPVEIAQLLKIRFVLKDIRQGRYTHDSSTKRHFDDDCRLGRSWHRIVRDALPESRVLSDTAITAGLGMDSDGYLQAKMQLAEETQRNIQRTWVGDDRVLNRGQLMFDAFKESRRLRRKDPDIRRWMRAA